MTSNPVPAPKTLIGPKSKEEVLRELQEAQNSEANKKQEEALEASLASIAQKEGAVLSGKDIPFDPVAFIKTGIIRKENLAITNNVIVDMESITQQRRAFAEKMVKSHLGESVQDNSYRTIFDTALLAMSITRINSEEFPCPDMLNMNSETGKAAVEGKASLFKMLLNSSQDLISTLTTVYNGLEAADILVEGKEPVIKK